MKTSAEPPSLFRSLGSLRGHSAVRAWLERALCEDRLPHAMLVTGPRGVGKRSLVRAVAAHRFCELGSACGACAECRSLAHGHHSGFVSIVAEAGSRTLKIGQIRELTRQLHLAPMSARGRVVLLEDAERMGTEAQDSLLKTLEEPPSGNLLFLTSERPDALLSTIRSRCQRLSLGPLSETDLRAVADELGIETTLPLTLACGCPGRLRALCSDELPALRKEVLDLLRSSLGRSYAAWTILLQRGLPAKADREAIRSRAIVLWEVLATLVRDLCLLAGFAAPPSMLRNPDLYRELNALARGAESSSRPWRDYGGLRARLAVARQRVEGYVDPASVLCGIVVAPEEGLLRMDRAMIGEG